MKILSIVWALAVSVTAFAQQPPDRELTRAAGAYLGSVEAIPIFRKECTVFIPSDGPGFEKVMDNEILGAFDPAIRKYIRQQMVDMRPASQSTGKEMIKQILAAAPNHQEACSMAAFSLGMVVGQSKEKFKQLENRVGYKAPAR